MMVYFTLFSVSFLSATLLSLGSEALLLYDISLMQYSLFFLWLVATLGNTLGAFTNYYIGHKGELYLEKKGHLSTKKMQQYNKIFNKYGGVVLLLSWMPIVGDPLTLMAGVLKYRFDYFVLIVLVAKGGRYGVIVFLSQGIV